MYLTGGQYKGRKIDIPDCAKPTLSKTRSAVFNVLFSHFLSFENKLFIDLFAGSGIMGLEAISRGFKTVSVDKNPNAVKLIKKNFKIASGGYEIYLTPALDFLENNNLAPDVIYMDPPWEIDYEPYIKAASKFKNIVLIIEYDKKRARQIGAICAKYAVPLKEKVYGRCKLDFLITP